MVMVSGIVPRLYDEARHEVHFGDVGLCRPSSLEGTLICEGTHRKYSHATLFGWSDRTLLIGETREHKDARLIDARGEIFRAPAGCYDVFRPDLKYHRYSGHRAWEFACHAAGSRYGCNHILRVGLRRVLGMGWVDPIPNSDDPQWPRDCSGLVHAALRLSGGPVFSAHDCDVVPGDLADPHRMRYLCTLFATQEQIDQFSKGVSAL
jgi:hypothetical protein